ncbi:hypothetical protein FEAC_19090 [Ferrimicrobium acidiphilum DSM 19497]|uniref:Uncharacterized protein n=1 Tax=Ferrimicrobium acidiphilum DSM 19497 TaxID=1121877 RepID=A0A0D8FTP3_9ACTN|nr:hypothetical protein FEAC_19090 [Ferrimicrobium acidiphilum DSM 19497]
MLLIEIQIPSAPIRVGRESGNVQYLALLSPLYIHSPGGGNDSCRADVEGETNGTPFRGDQEEYRSQPQLYCHVLSQGGKELVSGKQLFAS